MNSTRAWLRMLIACPILASTGFALPSTPTQAASISWATIGNPGNAADQTGYGAVNKVFQIGLTEVTNEQYVQFLNAIAATDAHGLFQPLMASTSVGGIVRSGSSGSYSYAVKSSAGAYTYGDKPVVWVSYFDAMRFANWLNNGTPAGAQTAATTEDGAYDLSLGYNAVRKAGANAWLPSENEWYKAAYYDPAAGQYFKYATGSNAAPNNNAPQSDTGNSANFYQNGWTTGDQNYPLTSVGGYSLSASVYGTFDQAGSVWEWTDSLTGSSRIIRGGSWNDNVASLSSTFRQFYNVDFENEHVGFRVASVPEPNSLALCAIGLAILAAQSRRPRRTVRQDRRPVTPGNVRRGRGCCSRLALATGLLTLPPSLHVAHEVQHGGQALYSVQGLAGDSGELVLDRESLADHAIRQPVKVSRAHAGRL